ncbi:Shedu immune nuclease family protein [Oscillatoria acuminata]|uniref:Shedu protein SduA C-terminal domain-containing protein n=1 Tax=Oscillatoria acuminata PCC 6304 TaxID=56110 RepID=K9TP52_9CYAN|nr:Shedu immune nuclease family protein [Oscillatoria acuminata]AFY84193.1 hypothetical protein Oscil6304_4681 [Oscillatoria acuminata PCC 6304]
MKSFEAIEFSPSQCAIQLGQFKNLLQKKKDLSERDDILPFFKRRKDLSALLGSLHPKIYKYDRLAFEYNLFGDFVVDLAIGDSTRKSYCFVEFESAKDNSIFVSKTGKTTPEWSPTFERGYSQIVDWFWKLNDMERTDEFENRFNGKNIKYVGVLVVGRNEYLEPRELKRLKWRQENTRVNSKEIYCLTFDELYEDLSVRLNTYLSI